MRYWWVYFLLLIGVQFANAQKPADYRGFIAGRPCELLINYLPDNELRAYCIDHKSRKSFELLGMLDPVYGIGYLHVQDSSAHFQHVYLKPDKGDGKLRGVFYSADQQGILELAPIFEVQYENSQDILAFNENYTRIYEEMELPMLRNALPFRMNPDCGRYELNKDEVMYLPQGAKVVPRKQRVMDGFRIVLQNWSWENEQEKQEEWLHLQMITYYPVKTMLAVVERRNYTFEQNDTSQETTYHFLIMANPTGKSWINTTQQAMPDGMIKKMEDKFPDGSYELAIRKLVLRFKDQASQLKIATPTMKLELGATTAGQQAPYFSWYWKKVKYEFR